MCSLIKICFANILIVSSWHKYSLTATLWTHYIISPVKDLVALLKPFDYYNN